MLFSGGACSRRVSLFKAVLFSAKMRKAREREKELGVGRERENFVFVVLFCFVWNAAGGRRRQKRLKVFLGNEEKERILMSEMFFNFFLFSFFFLETRTTNGIRDDNHSHTKYHLQRDLFRYFRGEKHLFAKLPDYIR